MMDRRHFLHLAGLSSILLMGFRLWPDEGIWNPCPYGAMPEHLRQHELLDAAWEGLNPDLVWDSHAHLIGLGDSGSGVWVNPDMRSLLHPIQFTQFQFYLNASCAEFGGSVDEAYIDRLVRLHHDFRPGFRIMLLAFDYRHDENGHADKDYSPFYIPNEYAARIAEQHPDSFEWIASIHPYREDCVEALLWALNNGARAIKWLPGAMGIDPSSKRCDKFYEALRKYQIPLLTHAGAEYAVDVADSNKLNNPLLLRRPLEQGVKVIVAHCASIGVSEDIEKKPGRVEVHNLELFARLMADKDYEGLLFGDISALTQINRSLEIIGEIFKRQEWHPRLINGSDYPLPGVMPVFSIERYVDAGYLQRSEAGLISEIRRYNPLLFDFLLKRRLRIDGSSLADIIFESGRVFPGTA